MKKVFLFIFIVIFLFFSICIAMDLISTKDLELSVVQIYVVKDPYPSKLSDMFCQKYKYFLKVRVDAVSKDYFYVFNYLENVDKATVENYFNNAIGSINSEMVDCGTNTNDTKYIDAIGVK